MRAEGSVKKNLVGVSEFEPGAGGESWAFGFDLIVALAFSHSKEHKLSNAAVVRARDVDFCELFSVQVGSSKGIDELTRDLLFDAPVDRVDDVRAGVNISSFHVDSMIVSIRV